MLLKLQCENCFANLEQTRVPRYYKCAGCGVEYYYEGKLEKAVPKWQPEGLVENPQGEWVTHFLYFWGDPKPPHLRYVGFKAANYHKEVEVDISPFMMRSPSMQHVQRMVADEINRAIREVTPEGLDPLPLIENLYRQAFRDIPLLFNR